VHDRAYSRRAALTGSAALAISSAFATRVIAAAPPPAAVGPALIEAARRDGKLAFYSALDLPVSEKLAKAFEAAYPGIAVRVERSGAERIFQRIGQELSSRISAVDVALSTDAAHFVAWKRNGWLAPYVPDDAAQHYPKDAIDPDGLYVNLCASLSVIGYNTNLIKAEDAPKSFAELLDPKWRGRLVKAHPGYSGTILTATFAMVQALGWGFFEKLAQQKVMQVQSAGDPPKKLALGERVVQVDGADAVGLGLKEQGQPVEFVHAAEGSPLITTQRPEPECRAPVPELPQQCRGPARLRRRQPAFVPRPGEAQARPHAALRDQADAQRSGRGRGADRGDQGALCEAVWGVRRLTRASESPTRAAQPVARARAPATRRRS
jgi:iron(III) transport system substrate-binding protein